MRHVSTKLLHVFVLVMEYRDLSAVAACTQGRVPTVAYSLARLREITGDPLFVKRNGMLEPTPHALRLEQTARQILAKWNHLVRPGESGLSKRRDDGRRVSIGFSSSIGDPVITEILTALCEQFPQDSFVTRPVIADAVLAGHLGSGELDCAFVVDSGHDPERVRQHNIMATPRRLVSATRGGSHDESESDWILLQEDCEAGSPLRTFLSRQASTPGHRETVVPSWHTQITLLHSAGGICPVLDSTCRWSRASARRACWHPQAASRNGPHCISGHRSTAATRACCATSWMSAAPYCATRSRPSTAAATAPRSPRAARAGLTQLPQHRRPEGAGSRMAPAPFFFGCAAAAAFITVLRHFFER